MPSPRLGAGGIPYPAGTFFPFLSVAFPHDATTGVATRFSLLAFSVPKEFPTFHAPTLSSYTAREVMYDEENDRRSLRR